MNFDSHIVQKYILSGASVVATIRRRKGYYRLGKKVIVKVGDKRFYGRVIAIAPITPFSLSQYVDYSGFESVEEWIAEAERLHKGRLDPNEFEIIVVEVIHSG
jgi:hypothetical protein